MVQFSCLQNRSVVLSQHGLGTSSTHRITRILLWLLLTDNSPKLGNRIQRIGNIYSTTHHSNSSRLTKSFYCLYNQYAGPSTREVEANIILLLGNCIIIGKISRSQDFLLRMANNSANSHRRVKKYLLCKLVDLFIKIYPTHLSTGKHKNWKK